MRVRDTMTPQPITIPQQATVAEALDLMVRNEIHELPVVDGNDLVGIITERDLRALLGPGIKDGDLSNVPQQRLDVGVDDVMSSVVHAVQLDEGLGEAARILADLRVGALPVLNATGTLVGILSVTDVLAAAAPLFEDDE
ncbi:MAG: CBS domain-containing protein [Oligoflexia bacterium]|nr:CBS domain-containing protein [Oligoflexia bacterium]